MKTVRFATHSIKIIRIISDAVMHSLRTQSTCTTSCILLSGLGFNDTKNSGVNVHLEISETIVNVSYLIIIIYFYLFILFIHCFILVIHFSSQISNKKITKNKKLQYDLFTTLQYGTDFTLISAKKSSKTISFHSECNNF